MIKKEKKNTYAVVQNLKSPKKPKEQTEAKEMKVKKTSSGGMQPCDSTTRIPLVCPKTWSQTTTRPWGCASGGRRRLPWPACDAGT